MIYTDGSPAIKKGPVAPLEKLGYSSFLPLASVSPSLDQKQKVVQVAFQEMNIIPNGVIPPKDPAPASNAPCVHGRIKYKCKDCSIATTPRYVNLPGSNDLGVNPSNMEVPDFVKVETDGKFLKPSLEQKNKLAQNAILEMKRIATDASQPTCSKDRISALRRASLSFLDPATQKTIDNETEYCDVGSGGSDGGMYVEKHATDPSRRTLPPVVKVGAGIVLKVLNFHSSVNILVICFNFFY